MSGPVLGAGDTASSPLVLAHSGTDRTDCGPGVTSVREAECWERSPEGQGSVGQDLPLAGPEKASQSWGVSQPRPGGESVRPRDKRGIVVAQEFQAREQHVFRL